MKNKLFLEIIIIVVFSVAIAIAYNYTLPKPLSFIYHKKFIPELEDDVLFGNSDEKTDAAKQIEVEANNNDEIEDIDDNSRDGIAKIDDEKSKDDLADNIKSEREEKTESEGKKNIEDISSTEKTVTYKQILRILEDKSGDFLLIDARNEENWSKKHIGNAINIFPYDTEDIVIPKILDLPQGKKIVVYCDGGNCDASHKLAEMMMSFGYDNVFIYTGGWEDWTKKQGIKD